MMSRRRLVNEQRMGPGGHPPTNNHPILLHCTANNHPTYNQPTNNHPTMQTSNQAGTTQYNVPYPVLQYINRRCFSGWGTTTQPKPTARFDHLVMVTLPVPALSILDLCQPHPCISWAQQRGQVGSGRLAGGPFSVLTLQPNCSSPQLRIFGSDLMRCKYSHCWSVTLN